MNCEDFESQLHDLVDGTVPDGERAGLLSHVEICERCRILFSDLQAIAQAARDLEPVVPSTAVWSRLSEQLERERGHQAGFWGFRWQTAAAAAVTLTLVLSLGWLGSRLADSGVVPAGSYPVRAELIAAEGEFTSAIEGLEPIARTGQSALDMETADVLRANLTVIDGAISESRAALQTEPDNQAAQESLFEALRSKVELLQDIVALINEMRKGDPEGAARIVSGLNQ